MTKKEHYTLAVEILFIACIVSNTKTSCHYTRNPSGPVSSSNEATHN